MVILWYRIATHCTENECTKTQPNHLNESLNRYVISYIHKILTYSFAQATHKNTYTNKTPPPPSSSCSRISHVSTVRCAFILYHINHVDWYVYIFVRLVHVIVYATTIWWTIVWTISVRWIHFKAQKLYLSSVMDAKTHPLTLVYSPTNILLNDSYQPHNVRSDEQTKCDWQRVVGMKSTLFRQRRCEIFMQNVVYLQMYYTPTMFNRLNSAID